jgi:hypothetical protein
MVSGVLGTSFFVEDMSAYLCKTLQLPKNVSFYALAADGSTTIHNAPDLQFIDARAQDSPTLTAAVGKMLATESGEATYVFRGATKRVLYAASPLLGWRFVVGIIVDPRKSS